MRSSHGGSVSGSVWASGEVVVENYEELEELKDREVLNRELHVCIMQEWMDILTWFINWIYYVRWYFGRYEYDRQSMKRIYRGSIKGRGSREDTHGWVLKHDSIIVKIDNGKWIKAEKGGVEPGMNVGGIRVKLVTDPKAPEDWKDPEDQGPGRYSVRFTTGRIELGNCKGEKEWTVGELRRLLTSCDDAKYSVFSANCWNYANSGAKAILEWAKENAVDEQVKNRVQEKLEELARLERPMPRALFRAFWNTRSEKSREVLAQFRRILTDTRRGLPGNSIFRRWGVRGIRKVLSLRAPCHAAVVAAHQHSVRVPCLLLALTGMLALLCRPSSFDSVSVAKSDHVCQIICLQGTASC